jgi:hypothetical protein
MLESPCLFCGQPTRDRGLFVPNDPQEYGAEPGKSRIFAYPLCESCRADGIDLAKVEALAMLAGLRPAVH